MAYRVMISNEMGERNVFEGSGQDCEEWIDINENAYPESTFYMEMIPEYCFD